MAQQRRSEILREFLSNKHSVLVTTNVLGRGIDLVNVRQVRRWVVRIYCLEVITVLFLQVYIFDMPASLLDFIHQVS